MADHPTTHPQKTLLWVHLARFASILGVIAIHVAYPLTTKWGKVSLKWWLIAETTTDLGRFSVPLFFALSGYLLLARPEPVRDFIRKRLLKVVLPLLAWSLIYVIWGNYFGERTDTPLSAIVAILTGPVADHLWFLYVLIGLYLTIPFFWKLLEGESEYWLLSFLALWFIFVPLKNFLATMFSLDIWLNFPLAGEYSGYLLLGYWLGRQKINLRWRITASLAYFITVGLQIYGNYARSLAAGKYDNFFANNNGLLVFIEVVCWLAFLPGLETTLQRLPAIFKRILLNLGLASYGIYFVHILLIEAFRRGLFGFQLSASTPHPLYGIPLTTLAVFLASLAVTIMLRNIPGVKKIVP